VEDRANEAVKGREASWTSATSLEVKQLGCLSLSRYSHLSLEEASLWQSEFYSAKVFAIHIDELY